MTEAHNPYSTYSPKRGGFEVKLVATVPFSANGRYNLE